MTSTDEIALHIAGRRAVQNAMDAIRAALDLAEAEIGALIDHASSRHVRESLEAAHAELGGCQREDCLASIDAILTDYLTSDAMLESLVEEEEAHGHRAGRDTFDVCRERAEARQAAQL